MPNGPRRSGIYDWGGGWKVGKVIYEDEWVINTRVVSWEMRMQRVAIGERIVSHDPCNASGAGADRAPLSHKICTYELYQSYIEACT